MIYDDVIAASYAMIVLFLLQLPLYGWRPELWIWLWVAFVAVSLPALIVLSAGPLGDTKPAEAQSTGQGGVVNK